MNNFRYADDTILMAKSEEEQKSLLVKVKEENEKIWLKIQHSKNEVHGIQFHHFMEETEREKWKQCHILFYWPPKSLHMVTAVTKLKDTWSLEEEL